MTSLMKGSGTEEFRGFDVTLSSLPWKREAPQFPQASVSIATFQRGDLTCAVRRPCSAEVPRADGAG